MLTGLFGNPLCPKKVFISVTNAQQNQEDVIGDERDEVAITSTSDENIGTVKKLLWHTAHVNLSNVLGNKHVATKLPFLNFELKQIRIRRQRRIRNIERNLYNVCMKQYDSNERNYGKTNHGFRNTITQKINTSSWFLDKNNTVMPPNPTYPLFGSLRLVFCIQN